MEECEVNLKPFITLALMLAVIMPNAYAAILPNAFQTLGGAVYGEPEMSFATVDDFQVFLGSMRGSTEAANLSLICANLSINYSNYYDPVIYLRIENMGNTLNTTPWKAISLMDGSVSQCRINIGWLSSADDRACGNYKIMSNFSLMGVNYKSWEYQINVTDGNGCSEPQTGYASQFGVDGIVDGSIDATAGVLVGFASMSENLGAMAALALVILLISGMIGVLLLAIWSKVKGW